MNSINPDVKFTTETAEDFPERRLHTLDTDIWLDNGKIRHSNYQKPMKTPYVLMQKSAMSSQQKFSILSNELIRRLSNIFCEIFYSLTIFTYRLLFLLIVLYSPPRPIPAHVCCHPSSRWQ